MKNSKLSSSLAALSGAVRKAPLFLIIFGFILVFSILDLATPKREFSENENKYLSDFPVMTLRTVFSGDFEANYEIYSAEQFLMRDFWIGVKSLAETLLFKTENNGIAYGEDGYLFPKFYSFDPVYLRDNLDAIYTFCAASRTRPTVLIVPSASEVLSEQVPNGLPFVDEDAYIAAAYSYLEDCATTVSITEALRSASDKYIYYRTDHHWTSYGAWVGYNAFCRSQSLRPWQYAQSEAITVTGFLGTHYNKSLVSRVRADVIEYFPFAATLTTNGVTHDSLYDLSRFEERDMYSAFLWGNNGWTVIESEPSTKKESSILVIKDSYANSLIPYLTENYNTICIVDPRYYTGDYSELADKKYAAVLILYSFQNLCTDSSVTALGLADYGG